MKVEEYKSFDEMPMFVSIPQAASILGVTPPCLYTLIETDKTFPVFNIGRRRMVPSEKLKAWVEAQCER